MARTVEVMCSDVNDVVADVVAVPIGCSLSPVRRAARALFEGSRSASEHLAAAQRSEALGLTPAGVVVLPKGTHPRGGRVALVAVHDDRPSAKPDDLEPDEQRVRLGARRLFEACEQARAKALALTPLGGVDMTPEDAVAIAADALVEHWRTHPLSELDRVIFVERTDARARAIKDAVVSRFPGATVRGDDTTTVIIPAPASASSPASSPASRPPLVVPPPEKPAELIAPYGLPTTRKHSARLMFDSWRGACGGSPIPAGCIGVAFRFASSTRTHAVVVRLHASGVRNAWLDGKALDDGRADLAMGEHVLAVECGPGTFAVVVDPVASARNERTPARVRAVADGAVSASPSASGAWVELDGGGARGGPFAPVLAASTEPLPEWSDQRGVWLPAGTRFVRFVFPIVFEANV